MYPAAKRAKLAFSCFISSEDQHRHVMEPKKVLIFGHSHTFRLGKVINFLEKGNKPNAHFKQDRKTIRIEHFGIGGLHINDLIDNRGKNKCYKKFDKKLRSFVPDVVLLMVGCNDIDNDTTSEQISTQMQLAASTIKDRYPFIAKIAFTQLLPRLENRWVNNKIYNDQAQEINKALLAWATSCSYAYFHHYNKRFPFPKNPADLPKLKKLFSADGVHLNRSGYIQLYKSIISFFIVINK